MGGNRLISLIVVLLLVGVGAYFFSPWFRTKVDSTIQGMKAWDAEARRKDPAGFIEHAIKQLGSNVEKFEQARAELRVATQNLEDMKVKNQAALAMAVKSLEAFKVAYKEASGGAAGGGKGWPVSVAGASYKEGDLKSQVNLLLSERDNYEKLVTQIDASLSKAESKHAEYVNRITDSKAKLSILGTQREMVKLNQLSEGSDKLLAEVNDVLRLNEALAEKPVVRTVEELMRDAGEKPGGANPNVDAFLNG